MIRIPRISIITCVWNQREEYFKECAKSVAAQPGDVEWIIADDGSSDAATDSYGKIVRAIATHVPVRFLKLPNRGGLSRARNTALAEAQGEWVVVLDSDDRLSDNLAELVFGLPSHAWLAAFETIYFASSMKEHRRIFHFESLFRQYGGTVLDPFLWFDFYYHGIIARRSLLQRIGGYRDHLEVGEDQDILFRAVEDLDRDEVFFVHNVGYEYRNNPAGVCCQRWKSVEANYLETMLAASARRGGLFEDCRLAGFREFDGSQVDEYEYQSRSGKWWPWELFRANLAGENGECM